MNPVCSPTFAISALPRQSAQPKQNPTTQKGAFFVAAHKPVHHKLNLGCIQAPNRLIADMDVRILLLSTLLLAVVSRGASQTCA
jgi:hypothetical protein